VRTPTTSKQTVAIAPHARQVDAWAENRQLARYLNLAEKSALEMSTLAQASS
jgi:hypothetical protein